MGVRIDKWLWAVRLYKTRSLASEACRSGKISMLGLVVKPSREIKIGDVIEVYKTPLQLKIRVKELLENRVGAPLVSNHMEDLTPKEEYDKILLLKDKQFEKRDRGSGRPTKKERRDIDEFKDFDYED